MTASEETPNNGDPVVRDKRRIDPETGDVRQPEGAASAAPSAEADSSTAETPLTIDDVLNAAPFDGAQPDAAAEGSDAAEVETATASDAQYLEDLKRVNAEYANYRKRTEANRAQDKDRAVGLVLAGLLPVLDDLDRAEKHGDLEGNAPFGSIAAKLRASVARLGLTTFGAVGDAFDPQVHEAVFQQPADDVEIPTVADVVESGYRLGEELIRVAKVVVQTPADH